MIDIKNDFIHVEPTEEIKGKLAWVIVNKRSGSELACIAWYPSWKRYVMITDTPAAFDVGCLVSIIQFIKGIDK